MKAAFALPLCFPLILAACNFSSDRPDQQAQNEAEATISASKTPDITPVDNASIRAEGVVANGIVIADLDALALGPKIVGPVGPEVQASLATPLAAFGDIESWVACPAHDTIKDDSGKNDSGKDIAAQANGRIIKACEPGNMRAGTVYTYVHAVTPGIDRPNDRPFAQPEAVNMPRAITAFRVAVPLAGFTGKAGYSFGDAAKALGSDGKFAVACLGKAIVFTVEAPKGGWRQGQTVRFFWQSTAAPAGPAEGYELAADGKRARGVGPAPAQPKDGEGPALNVPCV